MCVPTTKRFSNNPSARRPADELAELWLIVGLLRQKLWYYPVAIVVFSLFAVYQLYRFAFSHSVWWLLITAVDLIVIGLTWHEYKYLRRLFHRPH
jgi:uncharacterized membrane protein